MDFALLLVVACVLSGLIWAADALWFRGRRVAAEGASAREPVIVEYSRSFFPIILIVLLVRSFAFEPFRIPSGSMMPTLLTGDFIFVSKWSYGLRLPVTNTLLLSTGEPQRGDVMVFRLPRDPAINYIKRVVGIPGDVVVYRGRQLWINGEPVPVQEVGPWPDAPHARVVLGTERLGEREHQVLWRPGGGSREGRFVVPDGHYFVMGDNRDNSTDSRYAEVGMIPDTLLVGRAERIWMSWDATRPGVVWQRIGQAIR